MFTRLDFRGKNGQYYCNTIYAARLVSSYGESRLPPPIGTLNLKYISDPQSVGLPGVHHLQHVYPNLVVKYVVMLVDNRHIVERGGVKGLSLYCDYNGSGISAEVTSEMGRNALAPFSWEGSPGSPTDPSAKAVLEWRSVSEDGKPLIWQNHMVHGLNKPLDWRDGTPVNLEFMYDRQRGQVRQSVLVAREASGLGVAEQTLAPDLVNDFYSILLWFPRENQNQLLEKLRASDWRSTRYAGDLSTYGSDMYSHKGFEKTRGGVSLKNLAQQPIQPDMKLAAGGLIRQYIEPDPFGPMFWSDQPEVLFVLVPISEEQVGRLFYLDPSGKRTF